MAKVNHGARPVQLDKRDYSYLRTFKPAFGATKAIPDELNVDAGFPIPDQNKPNALFNLPALPYGCTDYTTAALCSDEDGVQYNPGFVENITHANAHGGADIRTSLLTSVSAGAQALGETVAQAAGHKRAAVFRIGQNLDFFDGIRTVLADNKRPISAGSPWFPEWELDMSVCVAPDFVYSGNPYQYPWHNWEISKATKHKVDGSLIDSQGNIYLACKSWQGENAYDHGWLYLSRERVNKVFAIQFSGLFTVAKVVPGQIETVGETHFFQKNLVYRQTDPEVAELQKSLRSLGYTIPHAVSKYFGPETKSALALFQHDHGINDDGSHFGPQTMGVLNALQNPAQSFAGETDLFGNIKVMLQAIIDFIFSFFKKKEVTIVNVPILAPVIEPAPVEATTTPAVPVQPAPPSRPSVTEMYPDWNTPKHAFHNARVMCDNAGLSHTEKDTVSACIYQESQFYNYLPNGKPVQNKNMLENGQLGSTDWGICQINDYYHIGQGKDFPSVDYVMAHPDRMVAYMIEMQQKGLLRLWSSYTSGAFRQWLAAGSPMWQLQTF